MPQNLEFFTRSVFRQATGALAPMVLLGIRNTVGPDVVTPAQLVYGSNIELPSTFFVPTTPRITVPSNQFIERLLALVTNFHAPVRKHQAPYHVPKQLLTGNFVWLRENFPRSSLSNHYSDPYKVSEIDGKTATVTIEGRTEKISIDQLKPAFVHDQQLAVQGMHVPDRT